MQQVGSRRGGEAFTVDFGPTKGSRMRDAAPRQTTSAGIATRRRSSATPALVPLPSEPPAAPVAGASRSGSAARTSDASGTPSNATPLARTPNDNFAVGVAHDMTWRYNPPPNNQTTKTFHVAAADLPIGVSCEGSSAAITFNSRFDSGNMIDVVQRGPLSYEIRTACDCQNSPQEVANKAWWYFSVTGCPRGTTLSLTIAAIPYCKSFAFGYAPVVACCPARPGFVRVGGRIGINPAADPPPPRPSATGTNAVQADDGEQAAAPPAKKKNTPSHVDISFDFTFDSDDASLQASSANAARSAMPVTYCFANTFPYSYARLQRHLAAWAPHCNVECPTTLCATHKPDPPATCMRCPVPGAAAKGGSGDGSAATGDAVVGNSGRCRIYTHRELLNLTPDGNRVDVLTITSGEGLAEAERAGRREALYSELHPLSSAAGDAAADGRGLPSAMADHRQILPSPELHTRRALSFPEREYVVLSARVHPGEVPASHILHGAIEMLLSTTDPRAEALRKRFVFVVVPMLNPDGVARGHSRADPVGQNLNRLYKDPHPLKQPTCLALRNLLLSLQKTGRLALYIDMHAHSNKKGAFLFGNAMDALPQVQNLLFAKLASLNSPYLDFPSCNFSEGNMYAVGKGGGGKDGSSRVMLYNETGFTHSYTLEMNYVTGPPLSGVARLPGVASEDTETIAGTPCPKYAPPIFHDVGRGLLAALLDLQACNPNSRLPATTFKSVRGVALWIQRALLVDAWEQQRRMSALAQGIPLSTALGTGANILTGEMGFAPCAPGDLPPVVTTRPSASFPPTTTRNLKDLAATAGAAVSSAAESTAAPKPLAKRSGNTRRSTAPTLASGAKRKSGVTGPTPPRLRH